MSKIMQNLVVLMEPSEYAYNTSVKGGNMILNRFCIDEDAGFELSGVSRLSSICHISSKIKARTEKGKEYCDLNLFK